MRSFFGNLEGPSPLPLHFGGVLPLANRQVVLTFSSLNDELRGAGTMVSISWGDY